MGGSTDEAPCIIVPTLDPARGQDTAERAQELAGIECSIFVAVDQDRHGYTRTVNEALSNVGGDAAILVDDCEVRTGWLATLQKEVYKRDSLKVWFAGPSGPCRTWPQNSGRPGDNRRPKLVSHVAGFCIYARHEAVLLGLDEQYVHYASDVDWQRRAQRDHGARALWVPSVYVGHALHEPHMEWWQHDHELLRQEWG